MKPTPRIIMQEIASNEMAFWTETERKEKLEILEKAKACCVEILTDILPKETCGRQYFESQLSEIERCIAIVCVPTHHGHLSDTFEYFIEKALLGYLGLWVVLILIAVLYGE